MGGITDFLFGGSDDSGQQAAARQNEANLELFERLAQQARGDALTLLPAADVNRNLGFQAALDVFGQGAGQQIGAFQQGNLGAQQMQIAGLPQIQNAILGLPTDLSGLQPQQIGFDPSFLQQTSPFTPVDAATGQAVGAQSNDISALLASLFPGSTTGGSGGALGANNSVARALQLLLQEGDVGPSPGDTGSGPDVSSMTAAQAQAGLDQFAMPAIQAIQATIPGFGLPMQVAKKSLKSRLDDLKAFGADGSGNTNTDPTAPGGIGGSAGDAASTGSGGFGPEFGGDGGFGL